MTLDHFFREHSGPAATTLQSLLRTIREVEDAPNGIGQKIRHEAFEAAKAIAAVTGGGWPSCIASYRSEAYRDLPTEGQPAPVSADR